MAFKKSCETEIDNLFLDIDGSIKRCVQVFEPYAEDLNSILESKTMKPELDIREALDLDGDKFQKLLSHIAHNNTIIIAHMRNYVETRLLEIRETELSDADVDFDRLREIMHHIVSQIFDGAQELQFNMTRIVEQVLSFTNQLFVRLTVKLNIRLIDLLKQSLQPADATSQPKGLRKESWEYRPRAKKGTTRPSAKKATSKPHA